MCVCKRENATVTESDLLKQVRWIVLLIRETLRSDVPVDIDTAMKEKKATRQLFAIFMFKNWSQNQVDIYALIWCAIFQHKGPRRSRQKLRQDRRYWKGHVRGNTSFCKTCASFALCEGCQPNDETGLLQVCESGLFCLLYCSFFELISGPSRRIKDRRRRVQLYSPNDRKWLLPRGPTTPWRQCQPQALPSHRVGGHD